MLLAAVEKKEWICFPRRDNGPSSDSACVQVGGKNLELQASDHGSPLGDQWFNLFSLAM